MLEWIAVRLSSVNVFIMGATGRTGRPATEQALARGHGVTVMVRRAGTLLSHERLKVVVGNPLSVEDLVAVLPGHDAVICCLGQRSPKDATLLQNAAAASLEAMSRSGVRRYLVLSQGLLFSSRNPIVALLRLALARQVADSAGMERLVRASDADWTIVRPPRLLDGDARGYRLRVGAQPEGAWSMQRADLATFLLDEAEKRQYPKAIVGITSA